MANHQIQRVEPATKYLNGVALMMVRSSDPTVGGYVLHELRLTQADLDRLSVHRSEPEVLGMVQAVASSRLVDWAQR